MSGLVSADQAEPNLVPILDMVFQLITFFMLVVNFKAADVDRNIHLPVVGSARPADDENQGELLVLNLRSNGDLQVRGQVQNNIEAFISVESKTIAQSKKLQHGTVLPVTTVIRSDKATTVELLMRVVDACRNNGLQNFDFVVVRAANVPKVQ
jgi:biopolymer transport protein ExbD